jgi:germination protein M
MPSTLWRAILRAFGTRIEAPAMRTVGRSSATLLLTLSAVLALIGGCSPAGGPLGTPSSPAPTDNASVVPPSGDATPGATTAASATATPSVPSPSSESQTESPSAPASASASPTAAATPTPAPTGTTIVRAYFVLGSFTSNAGLVPVLREIPATTGVASAAMRQLIAGPNANELGARPAMYTTVPSSTKLLGLTIKSGVATVNLSQEFETGLNIVSPDGRFAQVVYTLTQFSSVQKVAIQIEGSPLAAHAARDGYTDLLPAIFVDRPAWGAAAGNPVKVNGMANVFEATFRVQVKDANGKVVADQQVMASCGTGCWGNFSTSVAYTVGKAQWGTLRVFDLSAKDGTPVDVTEYPVWLTPPG